MLIQPPAAGFDEPLTLFAGCHHRIMHFCDALERAHVRFEDQAVFPLAARRLGHAELQALGRAMALRRQVDSGDGSYG